MIVSAWAATVAAKSVKEERESLVNSVQKNYGANDEMTKSDLLLEQEHLESCDFQGGFYYGMNLNQ